MHKYSWSRRPIKVLVRFEKVAGLTQEFPTSQREHVHQGIQNALAGTLHGLGFQHALQNSCPPSLTQKCQTTEGLPAFKHIVPEKVELITAVEVFPHNPSLGIWLRGFDLCFFRVIGRVNAFIAVQIFNWDFCLVSWSRLHPYKAKGTDVWPHGACPQSFLTCMTSSLCEILLRGFIEELLGSEWEILMANVIDHGSLRLDPSLCPCFIVVVQCSLLSSCSKKLDIAAQSLK